MPLQGFANPADYPLGQLVELVNQPPDYDGRSLDGTLARIEWVPKNNWMDLVFVELYRRHRRTHKPLALRVSQQHVSRLRVITEPTEDQCRLLEEVEPLREEQAKRRKQLKADRLAWEERILSMANRLDPPVTSPINPKLAAANARIVGLAKEGVDQLEALLARQPPQGTTTAYVTGFFGRQRAALVDALTALLNQIAEDRPMPASLKCSAQHLADIASLIEDGYEFALDVQAGGERHTFVVTPDFDGLYVSLGHAGEVRKLASTLATDLLLFIPANWPHVANAEVVSMTDDLAITEACPCKSHAAAHSRRDHEA